MRKPKSSSAISSVTFSDGTLKVKFITGKTYEYAGVTKDTYDSFKSAKSLGTYFHDNIIHKYKHKGTK